MKTENVMNNRVIVGLVSVLFCSFLHSMKKHTYPVGRPCGPVVFYGDTPRKSAVKDNNFSISSDPYCEYRKQKIHFKKMGKIDKYILKKTINSHGIPYIREALDKQEKQEPYVVKNEKEGCIEFKVKIPVSLIICSTFYKKNSDSDTLTGTIYENYNSLSNNDLAYNGERSYKIDECTQIEVINTNKKDGCLKCITKLYDRPTIEQLLNRPVKLTKHTKQPSVSPMSPVD